MKAEQRPPSPSPSSQARAKNLMAKFSAFLVFLTFGFVLGFLAGSTTISPSPRLPAVQIRTSTATITAASAAKEEPNAVSKTYTSSPPPPHDLLRFRTTCSADAVPPTDVLRTLVDKLYDGVSPYDNFPSPAIAELLLPPAKKLRGWGSTGAVFSDLISTVRPRVIIELGTFLGASALHMASLTRNYSDSRLPIILCIDDFRGWPGFRQRFASDVPKHFNGDSLLLHQFMAGVAHAGETNRVLPVPFSTGSALASLCEWGIYGDLIEVDAGHDFHSAWADINMAYAVLRPGGVLFGHDYFTKVDHMGVRRAVNLFAKVNGLRVTANGQHWVLSPKPHSQATSS